MHSHNIDEGDPLNAGFYSIGLASQLLDVSGQKLRGWLNGYANSTSGPVIDRDFKESKTISFLDLIELRFIEYFRAQSVSMHTIRLAAEKAREDWGSSHPFALSQTQYLTDRKFIFAQAAKESGDKPTWELLSGQHEMWEMLEELVAKGVVFDPQSYIAQKWVPRPDFPDVVIDPKVAFGKPVLEKYGVPTVAIYQQFRAEGHKSAVATWFDISENAVDQAVKFELSLVH